MKQNGLMMLLNWLHLPFQGEYKQVPQTTSKPADEFEIMSLCKRLGISIDEMKEMSFVSLFNILISATNTETEQKATQEDIDRLFG